VWSGKRSNERYTTCYIKRRTSVLDAEQRDIILQGQYALSQPLVLYVYTNVHMSLRAFNISAFLLHRRGWEVAVLNQLHHRSIQSPLVLILHTSSTRLEPLRPPVHHMGRNKLEDWK